MKPLAQCLSAVLAANPILQPWAVADELDLLAGELPIVLTPTRLRQSLADVPASVTVITAEMISHYGIRTVPDALRLVPGMAVTQITGNDYRINYHGTNILVPRRMNVLIDGVSVYRPAFARVDWKELPIAIDDIERIEVTRGPNSAAYGGNSMLAVINIISRHPDEVEGATFKATYGNDSSAQGMIRYGGRFNASTAYRVTLEHSQDAGFDYITGHVPSHDSTRLDKLSFNSVTDIQAGETVDMQANVVQGVKENQYVDRYQTTFPDVSTQDYYLSARWRKSLSPMHDVQIQGYVSRHQNRQDWRTCPPTAMFLPEMFALWQANSGYATTLLAGRVPSGGSARDDALAAKARAAVARLGARARQPTCVDAEQNYTESRTDLELQDTYVFSDKLRVVSGLGFRNDAGDSQTYLGGSARNTAWRAFANIEYKPLKELGINAGGFLERDTLTGSSFSPRLAVNYHLSDNHTLRFVASQADRMPDIQEQKAFWTYRASHYNPPLNGATQGLFFQSARAPGTLTGEKIRSQEIGLLSNFPASGLLVDARLFEDRLTDLISEKLQLASYAPTNNNSVTLRGAELQVSYAPSERWRVHLAYAYLTNHASTPEEQTQYARHSGSLAVSHLFRNGWRAALVGYAYGADSMGQTPYGREDLTISKSFRVGKESTLTPAFTLSYLNKRASTFLVDRNQIRENFEQDHLHAYFSLMLTY